MRGLLDNIRTRTRSPPLSRGRNPASGADGSDAELEAAVAASLVENNPFYPPMAPGLLEDGAPYPSDDDTAIAAAIAASLDVHDAAEKAGRGRADNGGNINGNASAGGSTPTPRGAHASQDLAFLTDRPLLPPAPPSARSLTDRPRLPPASPSARSLTNRPLLLPPPPSARSEAGDVSVYSGASGRGRNSWRQSEAGDNWSDWGGSVFGGESYAGSSFGGLGGPVPRTPSSGSSTSSRRRGRGVPVATTPGAHQRTISEEDEALAKRLQAQWISEDSAKGDSGGFGGQGGGGGGGGYQQPGGWATLPPRPGFMPGGGALVPRPGLMPGGVRYCASCGRPILTPTFRRGAGGSYYHMGCLPMAEPPLPPCKVCHQALPAQGGRIHFYRHNFFNDVYCPWHHDSSPRCCSCMRLEPLARPDGGGEGPFAELQDGRMVCMPCAQTAVVDSSEGAPTYQEVCKFFQQELNLMVPQEMREVPVLLVDSPTLNDQTHRDPSHGGGVEQGMPTTRGLTLSEVATVMHMAKGTMHFNAAMGRFEVGPPTQVNIGERRAVTAILVLCGLPYASFSSILAHEAMHAWIKLDSSFPSRLPPQVEEGVCQLIALLWLEHLAGRGGGGGRRRSPDHPPTNDELREFFAHQIKTDISEVYGDGFRKAKAVYDAVGLEALLGHIKRYQSFPTL